MRILLFAIAVLPLAFSISEPNFLRAEYHKYCVIGAGPAGLQLGYFFEKVGRDYIIFERNDIVGSFFTKMPRHGTLISINKRNTGKSNTEFNFRHDWNSLISDNRTLLFKHYSRKMFPHRNDLLRYLNDYYEAFKLKVRFQSDMGNIRRVTKNSYMMDDQKGNTFACKVLIIATGLHKQVTFTQAGSELVTTYEDVSTNPEDFEGKTVLIIGKGNSGFEVAASIYGNTNSIHLAGRQRVALAWATHYVGDLRGVNNEFLDTYQLKSLDGVVESDFLNLDFVKSENGRILVLPRGTSQRIKDRCTKLLKEGSTQMHEYDVVISCLGFVFNNSLTDKNKMLIKTNGKFPRMKQNYESRQHSNLFFAGVLTHYNDYKKSAGGFLHGFRYTVQALHRILEWRHENMKWPHVRLPITALVNRLIKRMNEASGNYQMHSYLGDVLLFDENHYYCSYIEEYPVRDLKNIEFNTGLTVSGPILVFVLEYGKNFSGAAKDPFEYDRAQGFLMQSYKSNFLHPVLYFYRNIPAVNQQYDGFLPRPDFLHHMIEDFNTNFFSHVCYINPTRQAIETFLNLDLTEYSQESCLYFSLTRNTLPPSCSLRTPKISVHRNFNLETA